MRRILYPILIISILFLSSCGMPTYHNFGYQSAISISSASRVPGVDTTYEAGFLVRVNDSDTSISAIDSQSPSVLMMYSLYSGSSTSLTSRFNTVYRGSSNYYNGSPATFESNGRLSNVSGTLDGENIYLYRFSNGSGNTSLSDPPTYTYSALKIGKYYYFAVRTEQNADATFSLYLDIYERNSSSSTGLTEEELTPTDTILLTRYNGQNFLNSTGDGNGTGDYSYYDSSNTEVTMTNYSIQLFMAVNLVPGESATFNNLYWSTLSNTRFNVT